METYLRNEELRFESRVTTVWQKSSNLLIRKFKWSRQPCCCINKFVLISVLHWSTLSVGLGLGLVKENCSYSDTQIYVSKCILCFKHVHNDRSWWLSLRAIIYILYYEQSHWGETLEQGTELPTAPRCRSVGCPLLQVWVHVDGLNTENTFHCWFYSV